MRCIGMAIHNETNRSVRFLIFKWVMVFSYLALIAANIYVTILVFDLIGPHVDGDVRGDHAKSIHLMFTIVHGIALIAMIFGAVLESGPVIRGFTTITIICVIILLVFFWSFDYVILDGSQFGAIGVVSIVSYIYAYCCRDEKDPLIDNHRSSVISGAIASL